MKLSSSHCSPFCSRLLTRGFSMLEALVTIAVMSILSTVVISSISNASRDAARMVSHQQHAALQSAVHAWVSGAAQTRDALTGQLRSMRDLRIVYSDNNPTSVARLNLIGDYLDDETKSHFINSTTNNQRIKSDALIRVNQHLVLPDWLDGEYPKVSLNDD